MGDFLHIHTVDLTKGPETVTLGDPVYPALMLYPSTTLYPGGITFVDTTLQYTSTITSALRLPKWYPHLRGQEIGTPKNKITLKRIAVEGFGQFSASILRTDYNTTRDIAFNELAPQLTFYVNGKVDVNEVTLKDETVGDFRLDSVIMEGVFSPTNKQLR